MPSYTKRHQIMVQTIQQHYKTRKLDNGLSIEGSCFMIGQDLIDHGALEFKGAIEFQALGLIYLRPIQLDHQSTFVIETHPDFRRACEEYERPDFLPKRENSIDLYGQAYGEMACFEDLPKETFAAFPYLGEEVFLLSKKRLEKEMATGDYRWLLFRTPYRPDKVIQSEIFMQNLTNPEADPVDMIKSMLGSK